jgi:SAM-dependent methyltransferase
MSDATYIHGTSEGEQARLAIMNGLLNRRELAAIGAAGSERCLELGAGTGVFARALADAVSRGGSVVAVERDERQLAAARRNAAGAPNLELRSGDALAPPLAPAEWGAFDLVHARFLLEHLPAPLEAVRAMVRAVRPGGRIVLVDDDHTLLRLWPAVPAFERLWEVYWRQYERNGTDPNVGRRLVALLVAAGARPVRTEMLFYGACAGAPELGPVVENLVGVVASAERAIVESGAAATGEVRAALADVRRWAERTDAALWYALPFAEGTRR